MNSYLKKPFYHGLMFHHFHDYKNSLPGQGSLSKDDFYKIIKIVGKKNILNPKDFIERVTSNKIKSNEICLTFDDGSIGQYYVALPVMEELNIKGFFFIYSSIFTNNPDLLELYRFFRINFFSKIDEFYEIFFSMLSDNDKKYLNYKKTLILSLKKKFPYYSDNDIKFRIIRDNRLTKKQYKNIMFKIFKLNNFNFKKYMNKIFINQKQLKKIHKLGHEVGLHSHTHPTKIESLDYNKQKFEYKKNIEILSKILNVNNSEFSSVAHPCGSYNSSSLKILKGLEIKLGFKQIMKIEKEKGMSKINNSKYEIARQDHSFFRNLIR